MKSQQGTEPIERRSFDSRLSAAMSLWCSGWIVVLIANYMELTWQFVAELKGFHWILLVSPAFWLWLAAFSFVLFVVLRLAQVPWHRFETSVSLSKAALLIITIPILLWFTLQEAVPYFYPALDGFVRLVPFLGGKGYA